MTLQLLCLTKTKLGKNIGKKEVALPGYTKFRWDRDQRDGSMALYNRPDIKADEIPNMSITQLHCTLQIFTTYKKIFHFI